MMTVNHQRVSIHIDRATVLIKDNDEVTLSFTTHEMFVSEDAGHVEACVQLQGITEKTVVYDVLTLAQSAQGTEISKWLAHFVTTYVVMYTHVTLIVQ